ncbi:glycosyltransferase family 2 protein [Cryobacterium luteum]|nr:glycosyltransferase family 2 protein [Cryobacterium luteum]
MFTSPNDPMATCRIAVVTVSYGSEDVLGPFLNSLGLASLHPLFVVVADNKQSKGTSKVRELTEESGALYLPLDVNRGYGHAINQAVRHLPSNIEFIVISNPDVVAEPGSIDILVQTLSADSTIAAAGPRILSSDGQVYPSARMIPTLTGGVGHALFSSIWPGNPWTRSYRRDAVAVPARRDAGWLSGAFLVARRSTIEDLHGFDENYFMYFEDVDLGYRIGKSGLRNVYEPSAIVTHTGAHSTATDSLNMLTAHHRSARRFLSKQYPGPSRWPIRAILSVGLSARSWLLERKNRRT